MPVAYQKQDQRNYTIFASLWLMGTHIFKNKKNTGLCYISLKWAYKYLHAKPLAP